ncbi:MAG: hypothetical protein D6734_05460 [Candidatus Schekmanbacteria bacterium]|nr:MAG: hypothetical protein D6734_05460 [Candidatus Schekmanbacteria bacterium]
MVKPIKKKKIIIKDEYVPLPEKIYGQIVENFSSILAGVGIVAIIFGVIWGVMYFSQKKEERASEAFSKAVNVYWRTINNYNSLSDKENTEGPKKLNFNEAKGMFQKIAKEYKTTTYGKWAELYLANCYRYEGNLGEAEKLYLEFIKKYEKNDIIALQAYQKLTVTLFDEGKYEDAIRYCNAYLEKKDSMAIDRFLFRIALCYEKINELNKAQTYYKRIVDEYPQSDLSRKAKEKYEAITVIKMQGL